MNPYLLRCVFMLLSSVVFTVFGFPKDFLLLLYGATIGVIIYAVFDNWVPPKDCTCVTSQGKSV